jgi:hypothetical protein
MKIFILSIILLITFEITKSQIVINEIVASNFRNYYDEDYDDEDWIELYNKSEEPVNLKNWKIFDKDRIYDSFILPDTIIPPKGRIVIFASGKNRYTSNKLFVETTGAGIVGFSNQEIAHFKYLDYEGDFIAEVNIDRVNSSQIFAGAGILFKESLDYNSPFVAIVANNNERAGYSALTKSQIDQIPIMDQSRFNSFPNNKVKIEKKSDSIYYYVPAYDHFNWYLIGQHKIEFNNGYLGLCFFSNDHTNQRRDDFLVSDFKINNQPIFFNSLISTDLSPESLNSKSYIYKEIHSNFSLSKSGEEVYLWNDKNQLIDYVNFKEQITNLSYSRFPDGEANFYFSEPTPSKNNIHGYDSIINPPVFSTNSLYGRSLDKVEIYHENPKVEIFYTLDGSEPTKESHFYQNQILLDTSVVIRAKAFLNGTICKNDAVFTYLPNETSKLPIMSLILEEQKLIDEEEGLFQEDNLFKNIELPIYFNYFDIEHNLDYTSFAGLKLHGKASRHNIQKSFRIYSRALYNSETFNISFWKNELVDNSRRIVLKNGGQDQNSTFLRDHLANLFIIRYLPNLTGVQYRPVISYLNQNYYGILLLRERFDRHFLSLKYNISEKSISILDDDVLMKEGDVSSLIINYNKILNSEDSTEIINIFNEYFDENNLIEYIFVRFFSAEQDWPISNQTVWNSSDIDKKWRWFPNDFDLSMAQAFTDSYYFKNMFEFLKSKSGITKEIFFKVLQYKHFQNKFGNLVADKLNSSFKPENTTSILDSLANLIQPELDRHNLKFNDNLSNFEASFRGLKSFLERRPHYMFQHIVDEFAHQGIDTITLTQNINRAGVFKINSIFVFDSLWNGIYFNEIPITVSVTSNPGYKFIGWENLQTKDSVLHNIFITNIKEFKALFEETGEPIEEPRQDIVINEIMYRPAENQRTGDWVELYNNGNIDIDLSNWQLRDDNNRNIYFIPEGTILRKNDFLILADRPLRFREYYGLARNVIGGYDFGFGEDDMVRLFNNSGNLVKIVDYSKFHNIKDKANRTGKTLELRHPNLHNYLEESWQESGIFGGTPLEHNSVYSGVTLKNTKFSYYPNPVVDYLNIENEFGFVKVKIYNLMGQILNKIETTQSNISLYLNEYNSGFYVIEILDIEDNLIDRFKIIKK